jgi:2-amino-4-hydroxy-6-hydroxymethyldihydropteridine diphosphokinase
MLTYIGIGSNQEDALSNCRKAIQAIASDPRNRLVQCAPFYRTEPVGKKNQDWFINGVIALETSMPPQDLLHFLLTVEKSMGRLRRERWGPRIIDLDLLFYGNVISEDEELRIPHPRLHERRFVLVPLKDIAPDLEHPLLHQTIAEILGYLKKEEIVLPLPGADHLCSV